ncbi:hypothetical protein ACLK1T_16030 [Escherichia coli]
MRKLAVGRRSYRHRRCQRLGGGVSGVLPDGLRNGTFLVAAAISRGKIICRNAQPDTLDAVLAKLRDAGADVEDQRSWISLDMHGKRPKAVNVRTAPHPAFPDRYAGPVHAVERGSERDWIHHRNGL